MMVFANSGCCGYGTRPTASLHSVAEEVRGSRHLRVGTVEHFRGRRDAKPQSGTGRGGGWTEAESIK